MLEEAAVLGIGPQLDDADLVDRAAPAMLGQPGIGRQLLAEGHDEDVAVLLGACAELVLDALEVDGRERMVERDDLHQLDTADAVEERVRADARDAEVLDREVHRLVVLDPEVVVVDHMDAERELGRRRGGAVILEERLLAVRRGCLLAHDRRDAFLGGLDGALVDIAADPPPPQLLCDCRCRPRPDEAIKHDVAGIGRCLDDSFKEGFRFLCREVERLIRLVVNRPHVIPDILDEPTFCDCFVDVSLSAWHPASEGPMDTAPGVKAI
jgi:hypothetical protein